MSKDKEKSLAEQLYLFSKKTQAQIAEDLGVSEKTFTKWKEDGDWERQKAARTLGKDSLVSKLYLQALKITDTAEQENRTLNSKEMDAIMKIVKSIDTLERKVNVPNAISVFESFNGFLIKLNPKLAEQIIEYQSKFLKHLNSSE